jgi:catechol 2,3-dioxygenase-like lactoylglutathione lyase family enzyme
MINGMHALIYARDADKARAFFRDVLEFDNVDAGHGWLIFTLPPSEVGIHPVMDGDKEFHQLYFMCDDIKKTVAQLEKKGVQCAPIQDAGFGIMTSFEVPGGGPIGVYQPRHPIAAKINAAKTGNKSPKRGSRTSPRPEALEGRKRGPTKKTAIKPKKRSAKAPAKKKSPKRAAKKPANKPARKTKRKR